MISIYKNKKKKKEKNRNTVMQSLIGNRFRGILACVRATTATAAADAVVKIIIIMPMYRAMMIIIIIIQNNRSTTVRQIEIERNPLSAGVPIVSVRLKRIPSPRRITR